MDAHDARVAGRRTAPWLAPWLVWLNAALERETGAFRARYGVGGGELRGFGIDDGQLERILRGPADADFERDASALIDERLGALLDGLPRAEGSLARIAELFELEPASVVALVLTAAPEVDLGYASIYAYLNDDPTMRLPTVDLCRRLTPFGAPFEADAAVVTEGLVRALRPETAPLWSAAGLVLSEPTRRFLLGPEAVVLSRRRAGQSAARVTLIEAEVDDDAAEAARERALATGWCLVEPAPAHTSLDPLGEAVLTARLNGAALFVPAALIEACTGDPAERGQQIVRDLMRTPVPLVLGIRPGWAHRLPLAGVDHEHLRVGRPGAADRSRLWWRELAAVGVAPPAEVVAEVAALFALGPTQIRAAAAAIARSGPIDEGVILRAARQASGADLGAIAERVEVVYMWEDLVLPDATVRRLRELAAAVRHRHRVYDTWAFGASGSGSNAVRVLLSGPSGTGKTMSAAVLARDLGLELYRVDLSAVVSKYIGETEKNLERVLSAAERSNALLLFDEADALFGKRSEVSDSHDRYANIEIAFLLQRIEAFDGVLLLATNLPGNLDDAFARRMQFHLEFPLPDRDARERLWRQAIPAAAPTGDDLDPDFLAGMFPLAGGDIRSAVLQAAFLAAHESEPIRMRHLVRAVARLRRQQGKLPSAAEFKEYVKYAREDDG